MDHIVVSSLAGFVLLFQLFATFRVRRSVAYAAEQKAAQVKLIRLLPVLGAATVLAVMFQDGELTGQSKDTSSQERGGNGRV